MTHVAMHADSYLGLLGAVLLVGYGIYSVVCDRLDKRSARKAAIERNGKRLTADELLLFGIARESLDLAGWRPPAWPDKDGAR